MRAWSWTTLPVPDMLHSWSGMAIPSLDGVACVGEHMAQEAVDDQELQLRMVERGAAVQKFINTIEFSFPIKTPWSNVTD